MLDTALKVGVKEVAQRVASATGGEVIEKSFSKAAKATPTPKPKASVWSNNGLSRHGEYKRNIRTKEAKQWVEELDPYDVNNIEDWRLLEPDAVERYFELIQNATNATKDGSPYANELWQEVNGATFTLDKTLADLRSRAGEVHMDPEDDFISNVADDTFNRDLEIEKANRVSAASQAGDSSDVTVGRSEADQTKSYGGKRPQQAQAAGQVPTEISREQWGALADEPFDPGGKTGNVPFRQQHHELIKGYFAPFIRRMRELGSEADTINLAYMADSYGFGLGDYLVAMKMMDRIPHLEGHEDLIRAGLQPDAKLNPEFGRWNMATEKARIGKIDNVAELTKEFRKAIEEVGVPMRQQMDLWQDSWEMIPIDARIKLIQLHTARGKFAKGSKGYKEANKPYKLLKDELVKQLKAKKKELELNEKQLKEFQSDEQVRRAMDAASPEDWTPQQRAIVASASSEVLGSSPELADFARRLKESKPGKPAPVTQVVHKIDMSDFIKRMEQMEIDKERARQAIRDRAKMVDVTPREPEPEGQTIDLNDLLNDRL